MNTLLVVCTVFFGQLNAEDAKFDPVIETAAENVQFERWQKFYQTAAANYEMKIGKEHPTPLKFQTEPIFKFFNPAGGAQSHGGMFVWTREGRPEVIAQIWSRQSGDLRPIQMRSVVHSMHSLSLEPIVATRERSEFWSTDQAGIEPLLIDAPAPAASNELRLAQMKNLVREFTVETFREENGKLLELKPTPVYRFEAPTIDRDGAIFFWFENCDLELAMVVETRKKPQGPQWHVGFARFTNLLAKAQYKGKEVWSNENELADESEFGGDHSPYYSVHDLEVLPEKRDE